jgi:2-oxoglutarate dehydrogenase E1 component
MGAWGHLRNRLGHLFATSFRYAGRPSMACPAEGAKALHAAAQKRLIAAAFGPRAQS